MAAPMEEVPYDSDVEKTSKRMLNEAKRLRAEGREYVNKQGQVKNERRTGDKCRCRRNCLSTFSPEATKMILENFNRIGSQDGQDAYLYGLITASQTVRRRPKGEVASHQQNHQFHYKVKLGEEEKIVCREGFASLHGVGTKRVRRVADHVAQGAAPKDKRGKHNNHRTIPDELRDKVDGHIRTFPFWVSHYGGHGKKKRYLSSELNITKMYVLFLEVCYPDKYCEYKSGVDPTKIDCEVKFRFYYDYYKANFNYGFGRPRSDVYCECTEPDAKIKVEKNAAAGRVLETKKASQKRKANVFYEELNECSELVRHNEDADCLCFDFKQIVPFPHLPTGART